MSDAVPTWTTVIFTGVLAGATIFLAIATARLAKFNKRMAFSHPLAAPYSGPGAPM